MFIVFLLCCLSGILEIVFQSYVVSNTVFCILLLLENLLLTLLLPMLTVYLLHCCDESLRSSKLLRVVFSVWAVSFALFVSTFLFFDGFICITPENQYYRGPLYSFLLIPIIMIPLLNLAGTIKRRNRLSHKTFLAFLIAILPIGVALIVHLFVDFYPLVAISYVLSALAMYSLILSDQIEQDRRHQQRIILQEREIILQEREIAEKLNLTPAALSYHLKLLREADMVMEYKQKNFIYYEINLGVFEDIILWVEGLGGKKNEK